MGKDICENEPRSKRFKIEMGKSPLVPNEERNGPGEHYN